MTSSAPVTPFLRTRSRVPPNTLADHSSQATAQIPSSRNPQIHQTAQRERQWLHSKSPGPAPLIFVHPILPPAPAWAVLSTRGAQAGEEEPSGTWKCPSSPPSPSLAQPLTPHSSTSSDPKRVFFFFFSPQVEKHPRGELGAIWKLALPPTFGKTNSKTRGEISFSCQGNPLAPLPPTQDPSSQPLKLPGDKSGRRRGHMHRG